MLVGSRVARAQSFARRGLIFIHDWQGIDAWLREKYGDRLEMEMATRGLVVMDQGLQALYPGEFESLVEEWIAQNPPSPEEAWLERCYAYAETELAKDLGVTVPLTDDVMERYAHQWATLLTHATRTFPRPGGRLMGAPAPGAMWLPAEGPVQGRCDTCRAWGTLAVEHRPVWGTVGEIPAAAPQVREGCPQCRRTGTAKLGSRLLVHTDPPASLAGVMPKLSATEYSWLTCQHCSYDAPCHFWVWVVCTAPGCTRESRATCHAPGEASGG